MEKKKKPSYSNRKGNPTPRENKAAKATPANRRKLPRDLPLDLVEAYVMMNRKSTEKGSTNKYSVADAKKLADWVKSPEGQMIYGKRKKGRY